MLRDTRFATVSLLTRKYTSSARTAVSLRTISILRILIRLRPGHAAVSPKEPI